MIRDTVAKLLSIDLGSSSVKVLTADLRDDGTVRLTSSRRFPHRPTELDGALQWRIEQLVLDVVRAESRRCRGELLHVSIDAWGSDIAFHDRRGRRVGPLRSYRDPALARGYAIARRSGADALVAERTGCPVTQDSTLSQLLTVEAERPGWLADVVSVLPIADHLGAMLTRRPFAGISTMSTTGFVAPVTGALDHELIDGLGIRSSWLPDVVVEDGVVHDILLEGMEPTCRARLVRVAGHDTATALRSGYGSQSGGLFASLGSWAVVGVVCGAGDRSRAPFAQLPRAMHEFTGDGRLRVNRNVPGMRVVQSLEQAWFGAAAPAEARTEWLSGPGDWVDRETLGIAEMDAVPPGDLDRWIEVEGRARHLPVATRGERYVEALRSVARGVADAAADLERAGLVSSAPIWACGGGTAVAPLVGWVSQLTDRPVVVGPVDASAEGGLLGAAAAYAFPGHVD